MSKAELAEQQIFTVDTAVLYLKSIGLEDATPWSIHQKLGKGNFPPSAWAESLKFSKRTCTPCWKRATSGRERRYATRKNRKDIRVNQAIARHL